MINDIVSGISEKLSEAFSGCKVYKEQLEQGLEPPCFLIAPVNFDNTPLLMGKYRRMHTFSITYHPKSRTNAKAECLEVQDELFNVLEYIHVAGKLTRGTSIKGRMSDGVLVCNVNYELFVRQVVEKEPMETLTIIAGGKG